MAEASLCLGNINVEKKQLWFLKFVPQVPIRRLHRTTFHKPSSPSTTQAIASNGLNWQGHWAVWTREKTLKSFTASHLGEKMSSAARLRVVSSSPSPELRCALYCRYSDDVQNDRSIERQVSDLEKIAPRLNLKLDKELYFEDRGQSATTLFDRPGLTRRLLGAVERGLVDVVLVEHTDRLARKGADSYWLFEQFKFYNVKVYTPRGEVTDIQLAFESYQNQADSEKTSFRVRSGHNEAAREGKIPGPAPYGYDDVIGKPGEKSIDENEAVIVVRIVGEMASGKSPRNIAFDLTRDGVPAPKGGAWTFQTVNKILQNDLYVGVYVRNKVRKIRNYNTGRRVPRPASPDDLVRKEMPRLRIVDQELWDAAQKVRLERAHIHGIGGAERPTTARRPHPFAGMFRCAECGGKMIISGSGREGDRRLTCSAAWWRKQCQHSKSYSLDRLTKLAAEKMHEHLTNPEFVKERAAERAKELSRLERESSVDRDAAQKELDRVELRIKKLVRLIETDESEDASQDVIDRYKELRVQQRGLQQRIALLNADNTPPLLSSAVKALARDVDTLHTMLKDNPDDPACRIALGNLLERVLVHPTDNNEPYDVSLYARHAAYAGTLPIFPNIVYVENQGLNRINIDNAVVPS
jgi:site-specific DNA recombinase